MTLSTEFALTRGNPRVVHLRFLRAQRVICGYRVAVTVATPGGRTVCPACVRFLA
jgi:hypothetical protein